MSENFEFKNLQLSMTFQDLHAVHPMQHLYSACTRIYRPQWALA